MPTRFRMTIAVGDRVQFIDPSPPPPGEPDRKFGRHLVGKMATVLELVRFGGVIVQIDGEARPIAASCRELRKLS
ncbi:hypothetical protein [Leptolyngbya sp. FACHB-261]|uniref:hypothetical protein n=1 Tax=Leptolyngbya sp. FACHB-261 TaxID=2692806 RepID=UPI001684478E|nr:hypothetical protein [Leptolyngbya sp. FACHB-261]MBD2101192.1 hypothetical protein [Leptolyngbya sp. FACHB-261]